MVDVTLVVPPRANPRGDADETFSEHFLRDSAERFARRYAEAQTRRLGDPVRLTIHATSGEAHNMIDVRPADHRLMIR